MDFFNKLTKTSSGKHSVKGTFLLFLCILSSLLLCGCSKKKQVITSMEDLKNDSYVISILSGIGVEDKIKELCPDGQIVYYDETTSAVEALQSGKVDAVVMGEATLTPVVREHKKDGFTFLPGSLRSFDISLALYKNTPIDNYEERVNECLRQYKETGLLDEIKARWADEETAEMPDIKKPENPVYTIKAVTCGTIPPHTYYKNGKLAGYDIEVAERVAADLGCAIEWSVCDFLSMQTGVGSGNYDMIASNLYVTDEKRDSVLFSEAYDSDDIVFVTINKNAERQFNTLDDLKNAETLASKTGTVYTNITREMYPQAEIREFSTTADLVIALQTGKADAFLYDEPVLKYIAASNEGLSVIPEMVMTENYYFCTAKTESGAMIAEDFNSWLKEASAAGILDEMKTFWTGTDNPDGRIDLSEYDENKKTLTIGVDAAGRPNSYIYNNELAGYPVELAYRYCKDRGYNPDFQVMDFSAFPAALSSGKVDMFADFISYTEERAENLTFTDPVYEGGVAAVVRSPESSKKQSFLSTLKLGLEKTFVREERWKTILSGLGITLLISFLGFILANILGAVFCAFNMSKSRILKDIADVYSRIMQGTPLVVVLMILYYVIFGKTKLSGVAVAIIGFGLVSGSSLAQSFEGSIRSIDRGQTEAALSLGFSNYEAFTGIVFPQALRLVLPSYFSELISLLKSTSIVGYIAVIDLTKASDIIRASTYEAFFPLISIAAIYFIIINILLSIMKAIQKSLEPKRFAGKGAEK